MTTTPNTDETLFLFYCDMTALSAEQRTAHQQLIGQLFGTLPWPWEPSQADGLVMQVRSTPTFIFFRNGQEIDRIVGAGKKPHYSAKLEALLG